MCEFSRGKVRDMREKKEMDFPNGRFHFPKGMRGRPMCILASRDKRGSRRRQVDTETAARENGFGKAILPEDKLLGRQSAILVRRIKRKRTDGCNI